MDPRYKSPTANVDRDERSDFRDLARFTSTLVWMLRVGALLSAVSFVSSWMQLDLLSAPFTQAEAEANDVRNAGVTGLTGVLTLVIIFVFGRWMVLAHRNLEPLGVRFLEFTPGWAVGWFFIPIANLWKPYQAMRWLWQASHSAQQPQHQDAPGLLPLWWTFWLISSFLGNASFRYSFGANTVEQLARATRYELANYAVDVVLYLLAAVMVGRIWAAQRRQQESPQAFQPSPGFADGVSQAAE